MYILYTCICVGVCTVVCCVLKYVRRCSMNVSVDYCVCVLYGSHYMWHVCIAHCTVYSVTFLWPSPLQPCTQ